MSISKKEVMKIGHITPYLPWEFQAASQLASRVAHEAAYEPDLAVTEE